MARAPSTHMGIGRGRFRKSLRAVLLSQHTTANLEALVRDEFGWNCVYCGVSGETERLQLDHLWPESQGGCLVLGNVVPACPTCNSDRREVSWQEYLRTAHRARRYKTSDGIEAQIDQISQHMQRHGQSVPPTLEAMLTAEELLLLEEFDLLLSALSDGALAKNGYEKPSSINFDSPREMFDELVAVAKRYQITRN